MRRLIATEHDDDSVEVPVRGADGTETACCEHVHVAVVVAGRRRAHTEELTGPSVSAEIESIGIDPSGSLVAVLYRSTPKRLIAGEKYRNETHRS